MKLRSHYLLNHIGGWGLVFILILFYLNFFNVKERKEISEVSCFLFLSFSFLFHFVFLIFFLFFCLCLSYICFLLLNSSLFLTFPKFQILSVNKPQFVFHSIAQTYLTFPGKINFSHLDPLHIVSVVVYNLLYIICFIISFNGSLSDLSFFSIVFHILLLNHI